MLRVGREAEVAEYFGQEMNRTTYNLARMNMILHGVHYSKFDIQQEDTLEHPQHLDKRFEAVVANPPFSAQWKGTDNPLNNTDDRFSQYGKLAPSTKADFAFVQHMFYQLADNGTMACILPHGVLFRGAAESAIREYMIKDLNCIDAVIGLPANLFYGTSIPTCILVVKKCRTSPNDILFIDASGEGYFVKEGNQNKLTDDNVDAIIKAYRERKSIDKYAHVATLDEVAQNDYNLNIPRYVNTFEEEAEIDLSAVAQEYKAISDSMTHIDNTIAGFCAELGIDNPFDVNIVEGLFSQRLRFKDSSGNPFPDWQEKTISNIGEVIGGGTPSTTENLFWEDGDVNWFTPSEVGKSKYIDNSLRKITLMGLKESSAKILPKGAILLTSRATIGEVAILRKEGATNQGFQSIVVNSDNNNEFIYYLLLTLKKDFLRKSSGSTFAEISGTQIKKQKILRPHKDEQKKIADFLSALDAKIEATQKQLDTARNWKKGLLQKMFV